MLVKKLFKFYPSGCFFVLSPYTSSKSPQIAVLLSSILNRLRTQYIKNIFKNKI